jgi:hypothetical protein
MVERLGDRWGLNTASLSRRGSEVSERLCDVLVLREHFPGALKKFAGKL